MFWSTEEARVPRCSPRKVFLKISQISQENTRVRVSFIIKLHAEARNFIKKRLWQTLIRDFKNTFLQNIFDDWFFHYCWLYTVKSQLRKNLPPCASTFDFLLVYDMAITWLSRNHFLVKDPSIVNRAIFRIFWWRWKTKHKNMKLIDFFGKVSLKSGN